MFSRVKEVVGANKDALFDNFFSGGNRGHNKNASMATAAQTATDGTHNRNSSLIPGGKDSMLTLDSLNVRKTTQLGVRSCGFYIKEENSTKPSTAMGYKRVSEAFNKRLDF